MAECAFIFLVVQLGRTPGEFPALISPLNGTFLLLQAGREDHLQLGKPRHGQAQWWLAGGEPSHAAPPQPRCHLPC